MKKFNIALLFLGSCFLAYLIWQVGMDAFWKQVLQLGWGVVPLILSEGAANAAHTLGWRRCIGQMHTPVPFLRLFRMAIAGFAINYLLPTASLGGEASKAALLASHQPAPAAVASVLLDKLTFAIAHLILALLGAVFVLSHAQLPFQLWIAMAVSTAFVAGGMGAFLLLQWHGKLGAVLLWLASHRWGTWLGQSTTRQICEMDGALKSAYRERPLDLALSIVWHLIGHSIALLQAWLFLWFLHQPASLSKVACVGLLSLWFDLLTFAVPLNLGALEGSRILALKSIGSNASLGMALGIGIRIAQVFWACAGLVSYGLFTVAKRGGVSPKSAPALPAHVPSG